MSRHQRDPAKEAFWREVLHQFMASGLSVREFCKREQLKEPAFYAWRRTIGERDGAGNSEPAFVPAVINGETVYEEAIVLKLPSYLELRLPQTTPAERVAELVHALEARAES